MRTIMGLVKKSAVIALLAGLAACQAADGTSQAPDIALVDSVMRGLGAVNPNDKPIDYQPRAPLALPAEPSKLPEPETNVAGSNSADWPKQQENQQLKELKELYAGVKPSQDAPLTPEQMRGFRIKGASAAVRDPVAERRESDLADGETLTRAEQEELSARANKFTAQQAGAGQVNLGTRRYLTEPPSAYSTPSPDAPMPEITASKKDTKPAAPSTDPYNEKPVDRRCLAGELSFCK